MPAPETPYCVVQDVIDCCAWPRFGQLAPTAQTRLIAAATKKVDKHCRRPYGFASQVVHEKFNGRNQDSLYLSCRPIITVMNVWMNQVSLANGSAGPSQSPAPPIQEPWFTGGNGAWAWNTRTGKLVRGNGQDDTRFVPYFVAGEMNVHVEYWGGYQTLPDDVVMGTAWLVKYFYEQGKISGIFESESIGDYEYKLRQVALSSAMPIHVMALLAEYVQDDAF